MWRIMLKHDVIHKTGSTQRIALLSEADRATATGNMYRISREIWNVIFEIRQWTDKQTDRQTLIATLRPSTGSEVKTSLKKCAMRFVRPGGG